MSLAELEQATQNNPNMFGNFIPQQPLGLAGIEGGFNNRLPILRRPGPIFGPLPMPMPLPGPRLPEMPDYSSQFEKLGETLGGFGEQLGGFGKQIDALGSFNEQVGGLGKQFESVNNKLDSLEKGLGSLGNQLASIEQGQPKPQEVQRPTFNPFGSPFGFGLGSLFMRGY